MTKKCFIGTERDIDEAWKKELLELMAKAEMEERRLAEESGEFHH